MCGEKNIREVLREFYRDYYFLRLLSAENVISETRTYLENVNKKYLKGVQLDDLLKIMKSNLQEILKEDGQQIVFQGDSDQEDKEKHTERKP